MAGKIYVLLLLVLFSNKLLSQTEFDSLKRNSMLDTAYQPSAKPTFSTEFAELKISGFIQPALYIDNNIVLNNDLFVTSQIPTSKFTDLHFARFHLSANQSRLSFGFKFPKAGKNTSALIEADFFSSSTSQHAYFRLRHAYLVWGEFTVGQTWTNFGDIASSPNTLDLEGPNSMPASRVAQVKWKKEINKNLNFIFAIEEPNSDYTPLDSASQIKSFLPQFVIKPNYIFPSGHWSNSLLLKNTVYTDKDYSIKKNLLGWGFASSLFFNRPRKRTVNLFGIIGKGTQGSVNDFGGLGFDAIPKDSASLQSLFYYGGFAAYSMVYLKRFTSSFVFSYLHQNKPAHTDQFFKRSYYASANCVFAINKYFTIGGELLYGLKRNYDNSQGSAVRVLGLMRLLF